MSLGRGVLSAARARRLSRPLPARLARRAARDIRAVSRWWEANRPAAPGAVDQAVQDALALIRINPQIGSRAASMKLRGVRRVHLSRIPCHLYYRILSNPACIEVLALWDTRRLTGPGL